MHRYIRVREGWRDRGGKSMQWGAGRERQMSVLQRGSLDPYFQK